MTRPAVPARPLLVGPDGRPQPASPKRFAGLAQENKTDFMRPFPLGALGDSRARGVTHAAPPQRVPLRVSHKIEFCSLRSHGARG